MSMMHPVGQVKEHRFKVDEGDAPNFRDEAGGILHPVLSTYALAREAEWAGRLFALDLKTTEQEGIGTSISIQHLAPAPIGSEVTILCTCTSFDGRSIQCSFIASALGRTIATGETGQALVLKEKLQQIYNR